ncbi:MAG: hypothetical protein HC888_05240 [Candidatus Competibacteraceae bacterium]|nr:hypothetical protein [Candidatus Competibacteraceae bacterium]
MKPEVRKALEASIAKWERNAEVTDTGDAQVGIWNCALCRMFNWQWPDNEIEKANTCKGCPVYEKTGRKFCEGTPIDRTEEAEETGDIDAFILAAREEVAFLRSLL